MRQALESVLAQDVADFEVVVSDNSERDEVEHMMAVSFPQVRTIRRRPAMPALEHFRRIIEESAAEFVVLFHDDDVMMPGYLQHMLDAHARNPSLSAVACNALVMRGEQKTTLSQMGHVTQPILINTPEKMLPFYLSFSTVAPAPFPGYMYRRECLQGLFLDASQGGKFADVSFLMKVAGRAPMLWLPIPLMYYRIHDNNDGRVEVVGERLRLLRYILSTTSLRKEDRWIRDFKFRYWMRWWRGSTAALRQRQPWRSAIVRRFLIWTGVRMAFTLPGLWMRLLARHV